MNSPQKKQNREPFVVHIDSSRVLWMIAMSLFLISFFFLFGYWVGTDTDSLVASHREYSNEIPGNGFSGLVAGDSSGIEERTQKKNTQSWANKEMTREMTREMIAETRLKEVNPGVSPREIRRTETGRTIIEEQSKPMKVLTVQGAKGRKVEDTRIGSESKSSESKRTETVAERAEKKVTKKRIETKQRAKIVEVPRRSRESQRIVSAKKAVAEKAIAKKAKTVASSKLLENKSKVNFSQLKENTIYNIQISANRISENAQQMKSILLEKGYPAYIQMKRTREGGNLHIVRVGPFYSPKDLKESYNSLKNLSFAKGSIIVQR